MAEFLTAEEIAAAKSGSISDSQIRTAMDLQRHMCNTPFQIQHKGIVLNSYLHCWLLFSKPVPLLV